MEAKIKAQELRRKGLSYSEIQKSVPVPKSTLSGWCRDIFPTEKQALRLLGKKLKGAARGRLIGAKRQQAKRINQIKKLLEDGKKEVGLLSKRDRFIAGICLYAAEGAKRDKYCSFSNSDPKLIKFMAKWFREFFQIPEIKFRGSIWIHEELSVSNAIKFWSKIANIPSSQFHKTYIAKNKPHSKKIRKNLHEFGVFSLKFSHATTHRKIMGWIAGVLNRSQV